MAGSTVGKVNCYHSYKANPGQQQEAFKNHFDFFEQMVTAGYATRIALQHGLVGVAPSGLGTDYFDGAAAFGENAFALYRMNGLTSGNTDSRRNGADLPDFDYYVLIQWADAVNFGIAPGNPGNINALTSDGCGVAMAVRADGASPWNGTTNNDGTDSKGAIVWTAGASTLYVFPISNSYTAGAHLANKENMRRTMDVSGNSVHVAHFIGNADSFVICHDNGAIGTYECGFFGIYSPRAGLTPPLPLVAIQDTGLLPWADGTATTWGTTTGNVVEEAGVIGQLVTDLMSPLSIGQAVNGVLQEYAQPNPQFDPPQYDSFPVRVAQRSAGNIGYVGDLDPSLIRAVYGAPQNSKSDDGAWAYFGVALQNSIKTALAWDAAVGPPNTKAGRVGETF